MPVSSNADCIGVVTAGGGVDFWHKVGEGAIHAGREHDLEVMVRGPKDSSTSEAQGQIITQMLKAGCTGLVVAPNSAQRLAQLSSLETTGVHIVLVDRDFASDDFKVVMTNNFKAGQAAAEEMLKLLPEDANIALFKLSPDISSTTDRESGFLDVIDRTGMNVVVNQYIGAARTEATTRAYELLSDFPEIDAVFTPNESTTMAALNMRKRLGISGKNLHIGFDSHPSFLSAIENNEMHSIVVQKPYEMGYLAVKELIRLINGKTEQAKQNNYMVEKKKIETPVKFINKQNLVR